MDSHGHDDDAQMKSTEDNQNDHFAHSHTQILHSPLPVEDAFETQVVDIGETQVLEDDPGCLEPVDTQLVDEFNSDGEGTDKTEVLSDRDDGLSDNESQRRGITHSISLHPSQNGLVEQRNGNSSFRPGVSAEMSNVQVIQEPKLGPVRFTSVRAASMRASGLAARRIALRGTNSDSYSFLPNNQHPEEYTSKDNGSKTESWKEVDQVGDTGIYNNGVNALINANEGMTSCSAVRKLFAEDCSVENEELASTSDIYVGGKAMCNLPTCVDEVAGLSYIDSQEPGESSQANALACVQRLIKENMTLFDTEFDLGKSSKGKLNLISTAKGTHSLAKKTNERATNRKTRIFDWDDGREDEGGGDFLRRKKEELFGAGNIGQRSFMKLQKAKGNQPDGYRGKVGKSGIQNGILVHSDSKIVLHRSKLNEKTASEAEMNVRKNLLNELNEQSNIETSTWQLGAAFSSKVMPEMLNVGLDTQIAAEAMETLLYGDGFANSDVNDVPRNPCDSQKGPFGKKVKKSFHSKSKQHSFSKDHNIGVATRQSKRPKTFGAKSSRQPSISSKKNVENVRNECDMDLVMTRRKKAKSGAEILPTSGTKMVDKRPSKMARSIESSLLDGFDGSHGIASTGSCSVKKQNLPGEMAKFAPIAHRTRRSLVGSQLKIDEIVSGGCREETNFPMEIVALEQNKASASAEVSKVLDAKGKSSELICRQSGKLENIKSNLTSLSNGVSCPRRRRSCRLLSDQLNEPNNLDAQSKPSNKLGNIVKYANEHKRPRSTAKTTNVADSSTKRKTRSSMPVCTDLSSTYQKFERESSPRNVDKLGSYHASLSCTTSNENENISQDQMGAKGLKLPDRENNAYASPSVKHKVILDNSPKEVIEASKSACTLPANCMTPVNAASPVFTGNPVIDASPVCIGNGYFKRSCTKSLPRSCLKREISSLLDTEREPLSPAKDLRKRRDLSDVRILFSHHLDEDIIKQQRKIADRLKVSIASSITDATHFITDKFVRTRNMLEAIAAGKPVVTHLWLENVGQAKYYIDEQKYILRDLKKEGELGFNMPVSLAHACQHPLLRDRRVLITPNTKPSKEILSGLVKAVCGQAVERVGRSALKDDTIPEDLLVLSCEEDYEVCVPFLERGAAVYSSELLLNGIVTQKLDYERHQLFSDHVKRTRSTIWLKKGGNNFIPVTKRKYPSFKLHKS